MAAFILQRNIHAAAVVSVLTLLALPLPILHWLSGAVLVLVGLSRGRKSLLLSAALACALSFLIHLLLSRDIAWLVLGNGLLLWLPVVVATLVMRQQASLLLGIFVAQLWGGLFFLYQTLLNAEQIASRWQQFIVLLGQSFDSEQLSRQSPSAAQWQEFLAWSNVIEPYIAAFIAFFLVANISAALIVGGHWSERLQGATHKQFRCLRFGFVWAALFAFLVAIWILQGSALWLGAILIVGSAFLLQGLSLAHFYLFRQQRKIDAVLFYLLLLLFPPLLLLLLLLGWLDNWLDWRQLKKVPH